MVDAAHASLNGSNKAIPPVSQQLVAKESESIATDTEIAQPIQPEGSPDADRLPSPDCVESPPLPPLPDANASEETIQNNPMEDPVSPPKVLPQVAIQEAGLSRIENLLVALLSRVDESAQRQQQELPPPLPDKGFGDSHFAGSQRSCTGTENQSDMLDLDADVALWKSRGKGVSAGDVAGGPWNDDQRHCFGQSVGHAPSVYPPTEAETHSSSDQPTPQVIPVSYFFNFYFDGMSLVTQMSELFSCLIHLQLGL